MKKFIKKLAYLVLPLLLLSIPLDLFFSSTLKKSHGSLGEFEVWNDIYNGNINAEIAIYGSSRAWVQINPSVIENKLGKTTYNFGIDGHNFNLQYLRHLEFIKNNPKPKHIIVNVDVFTLQKREDLYKLEQFLPYMFWNKNIKNYTDHYNGFNASDYYVPFLRYIGKKQVLNEISSILFDKNRDTTSFRNKGYKGFDLKWDKSIDTLLASDKKYTIKFHKETRQLFEQFIKESLDNNILITLVYAPEYIEGQYYVENREEAINIFRELSKKYDLKFLDYSKDSLSYNKALFYNASHLNIKGSQLFTKKLSEDLLKNSRSK